MSIVLTSPPSANDNHQFDPTGLASEVPENMIAAQQQHAHSVAPRSPARSSSGPSTAAATSSSRPAESRRRGRVQVTGFGFGTILRRAWRPVRWLFSPQGRDIRQQLGILFRMIFTFAQIIIIMVVLSLSASKFHAHTHDLGRTRLTEWDACDRPLGIWSALWAARAILSALANIWEWKRHLAKKQQRSQRRQDPSLQPDIYGDGPVTVTYSPEIRSSAGRGESTVAALNLPPSGLPSMANTDETVTEPAAAHMDNTGRTRMPPPRTRTRQSTASSSDPVARRAERASRAREEARPVIPTASDALFDRFDTFLTTLALMHFIGNHILLYTSVHTCRLEAPHIWWLAFGVASLGYIIVLELVLIAFVVFILGPILLLILNLVMLCLGRPMDRHGNLQLRPEIPKLEVRWIDQIPMAVYIPPVTEDIELPNDEEMQDMATKSPAEVPPPSMTTPANATSKLRRWPFGKQKQPQAPSSESAPTGGQEDPRFEKAEYPFVVLERNRATCPICLTDFVEPPRRVGVKTVRKPVVDEEEEGAGEDTPNAGPSSKPAGDEAKDEETGVPGEPLRLLACGHAFHKPCLDQWLTTVSGRCPVCSQKVEVSEKKKEDPK